MVLRCGIAGDAADSLLRTFDLKVACHERTFGSRERAEGESNGGPTIFQLESVNDLVT